MTTATTVTVNVTQLDPEDYYDKTGKAGMATELAEKYGAVQTGGGTDFATELSDMDFEVDLEQLFGFTAALDAFEITWKVFLPEDDE